MSLLATIFTSGLVLLSLNRPDGVYAAGDTVRVYANDVLVHEEVCCGDSAYNPIFRYEDTCIGWVVNPSLYTQKIPCPKDFDRFWEKELWKLRHGGFKPALKEVPSDGSWDGEKYVCYEIEIPITDSLPSRGYIAMPRGASRRSLPVILFTHAAGVAGRWVRSFPSQTVERCTWGGERGAISIDINPLGMLNDQPQAYYDSLEAGPFRDYENLCGPTPKDHFFKGMYLRVVAALDYACSLPQWDQKCVLAYGQSQGGRQALAVAGLDSRVSDVVAIIPGGCNRFTESPYCDCCNLVGKTSANIWLEIGLMDRTCPPFEIYPAANLCKNVQIATSPWRYHNEPDERYWKHWMETIYTDRMNFIYKVLSK